MRAYPGSCNRSPARLENPRLQRGRLDNRAGPSARIVKRGGEDRIIEPCFGEVCFNIARGKTVDTDAFVGPLDGQSARHAKHAPLALRIRGNMANAHLAGDTADVDDLALASIMLRSKAADL
jgi:hypothetical protein